MKHLDRIAGAIFDVDDTLLDNQPDRNPLSNLHQIARLDALHAVGRAHPELSQLLEVEAQENYDAFPASPVHTVQGAFYTLLKNRGIVSGDVDPNHPLIQELVRYKDAAYAKLLVTRGKPITGADTFVRDFATQYEIEHTLAIASTATLADITAFLGASGLSHLFPATRIVSGADVTHPKPHPEGFNKAFHSLGLPDDMRGHVIALEDDPRGMLSARKAGLYVCGITTRYTRDQLEQTEAQPDLIVDSYAELSDIFKL